MAYQVTMFTTIGNQKIIGKQIQKSEDDGFLYLEHPLLCVSRQTGPDTVSTQFVPWDAIDPEGVFRFNPSAILGYPVTIPQSLEKAYIQQTSSLQIISALDQMESIK